MSEDFCIWHCDFDCVDYVLTGYSIRWLIDHGAVVDVVGGELQATPLQWAARSVGGNAMHQPHSSSSLDLMTETGIST